MAFKTAAKFSQGQPVGMRPGYWATGGRRAAGVDRLEADLQALEARMPVLDRLGSYFGGVEAFAIWLERILVAVRHAAGSAPGRRIAGRSCTAWCDLIEQAAVAANRVAAKCRQPVPVQLGRVRAAIDEYRRSAARQSDGMDSPEAA